MLFSEVGQCRHQWKWIGRALKHCSRWDHLDIVFRRKVITTSGIRPPFCNFRIKEASGEVGIYTSEKLAPKNIGIANEIASISVSVVKLLVLPVWGIVSTSDLYLMLFSEVGWCRYRWKWIGHARKLCRSLWHHVDISSCHQLNYFRFPSAILNLEVQEVSDTAGVRTTEKFANENRWNLVSS